MHVMEGVKEWGQAARSRGSVRHTTFLWSERVQCNVKPHALHTHTDRQTHTHTCTTQVHRQTDTYTHMHDTGARALHPSCRPPRCLATLGSHVQAGKAGEGKGKASEPKIGSFTHSNPTAKPHPETHTTITTACLPCHDAGAGGCGGQRWWLF